MNWALPVVALAVLGVAAFSRRMVGTSLTPAMVFVAVGVLVGPLVADAVDPSATSSSTRTLAEATLAVVLFSDASRINLRALRREYGVPVRLLGIGLPLTIALGAVAADLIFSALTLTEALLLAIVLAPTDAALGQAVVSEPRLPSRVRQGLNVESGLNDGICVPLLLIALAAADVESHTTTGHHAVSIVFQEIGYGILGGVLAGAIVSAVTVVAGRRRLIAGSWLQVVPLAGAALAYGTAVALHGSGFIGAFVAGAVYRAFAGNAVEEASRLSEEVGALLGGVTLLVFGAILLGPALQHVEWQMVLYAVLSLTVVRMLPVALSMLGSGARLPTVGFLGWFGPRGLASIVFALIVVEESTLPGLETIVLTAYLTVGLSVFAHGISAAPLADRYARWFQAHPRRRELSLENAAATAHPARRTLAGSAAPGPSGP
jgi:NhaP-type Na+/H+ or K+/H+ antiporter